MNKTEHLLTVDALLFKRGDSVMKLHVDLKERGYDIVLQRGVLKKLASEINVERNVLLVSAETVDRSDCQSVSALYCKNCSFGGRIEKFCGLGRAAGMHAGTSFPAQ